MRFTAFATMLFAAVAIAGPIALPDAKAVKNVEVITKKEVTAAHQDADKLESTPSAKQNQFLASVHRALPLPVASLQDVPRDAAAVSSILTLEVDTVATSRMVGLSIEERDWEVSVDC